MRSCRASAEPPRSSVSGTIRAQAIGSARKAGQREANGRFGFSAKNTLGLAQALYEKHKVLTYPRTDSRALPEDYIGTVKQTLSVLESITGYSTFAAQILRQDWVKPNKLGTAQNLNSNTKDHYFNVGIQYEPVKIVDLAIVYKRDVADNGLISTQNGTIGGLVANGGRGTYDEVGLFGKVSF